MVSLHPKIKDLIYVAIPSMVTVGSAKITESYYNLMQKADAFLSGYLASSLNGLELTSDIRVRYLQPENAIRMQEIAVQSSKAFIDEAVKYKAIESVVSVQSQLESLLYDIAEATPTDAVVSTIRNEASSIKGQIDGLIGTYDPGHYGSYVAISVTVAVLGIVAALYFARRLYKNWRMNY